jgi:predicted transcriptional regulator
MLSALLDGGALTATELAYRAGVSPQTASSHLALLTAASLVAVEAYGRYRYYRLAGSRVAEAIEALLRITAREAGGKESPLGPVEAIRFARMCYDHLAGRLGVALTHAMMRRKHLVPAGRDFRLTRAGTLFLEKMGVDVRRAEHQRRAFARQCLDWTERRPHLAGALGAALTGRLLEAEWLGRVPEERTLALTERGKKAFVKAFGLTRVALTSQGGPMRRKRRSKQSSSREGRYP